MNIAKIRELMAEEKIVFSFSGMISQSLITLMIESLKNQFESTGEDYKIVRNMFHIAIEQLQNIMSYSKDKNILEGNRYVSPGVLVIGYNETKEKYYVNSSNQVLSKDKDIITKKIDHINSLNKDELRKLARKKLRTSVDRHERGAGLGLIEIAKKSSEKLEYSFDEIDEKIYFNIRAYV